MACCVARYRASWMKGEGRLNSTGGFTVKALHQQLRRCLAGYHSMQRYRSLSHINRLQAPLFDIRAKACQLTEDFDSRLEKDESYDFFLPWDVSALPGSDRCFDTILQVSKGKKRGRSVGDEGEADERPARRPAISVELPV